MRKLIILAVLLVSMLMPAAAVAEETDLGQLINDELSSLDTGGLEQIYGKIDPRVSSIFGEGGFEELIGSVASGQAIELEDGIEGLIDYIADKFRGRLALVLTLVALSVLGGVVNQLKQNSGIAGLVCYALAIIVAIYAFAETAANVKDTVAEAKKIMELSLPVMLTMLTTAGAAASSSMLTPVAGVLTTGVMNVFSNILLPAILAMGVCVMIGNLSERKSLDRISGLLKSVVKWLSGAVSVLYLGYGTIMGIAAKGADGLSVKLIRYSADKLIPVVGSMVSGSVDTIVHSSVIIKNALGVGSVFLMFGVMLSPLIDIMTLQLTFRVTAALIEPYGDERMIKGISSMADVMSYLFAAAAGVAVMFAVTVALIAAAGNAIV